MELKCVINNKVVLVRMRGAWHIYGQKEEVEGECILGEVGGLCFRVCGPISVVGSRIINCNGVCLLH